jgi:hypothetical protein
MFVFDRRIIEESGRSPKLLVGWSHDPEHPLVIDHAKFELASSKIPIARKKKKSFIVKFSNYHNHEHQFTIPRKRPFHLKFRVAEELR